MSLPFKTKQKRTFKIQSKMQQKKQIRKVFFFLARDLFVNIWLRTQLKVATFYSSGARASLFLPCKVILGAACSLFLCNGDSTSLCWPVIDRNIFYVNSDSCASPFCLHSVHFICHSNVFGTVFQISYIPFTLSHFGPESVNCYPLARCVSSMKFQKVEEFLTSIHLSYQPFKILILT